MSLSRMLPVLVNILVKNYQSRFQFNQMAGRGITGYFRDAVLQQPMASSHFQLCNCI